MSRVSSWSMIGNDVAEAKTVDDVLKMSGLDYTVKKCPLFTTLSEKNIACSNAIKFPHTVATVNESTGDILGIVSDNYEVCQNRDAFEFVNYIDGDLKFVKAGQTRGGMVYIIGALPNVKILGDDFTPYVIFQNGHNGGITIKATIAPLRIVCQNQFNIAFRESQNTVSIRHTSTMQDKLVDARNVMAKSAEYMKTLSVEAEKFAKVKLTDQQITKVVDDMFPIKADMTARTVNKIENNRARFMEAYLAGDNANFRNSMFGLINAEADYLTHVTPARKTDNWDENHFIVTTFSPAMIKFINQIKAVTGVSI